MKDNSQILLDNLEEDKYESHLINLKSNNPDAFHGDVTISEAYEHFEECKAILINAIRSGSFEKLSYKARSSIKVALERIAQYKASSSRLIQEAESFCDLIYMSGLIEMGGETEHYLNEIGALKELNKKLKSSLKKINNSEEIIGILFKKEEELDTITSKVNDLHSSFQVSDREITTVKENIDKQLEEGAKVLESIKTLEEEASSKETAIETFKKTIDEYKDQIDNLQERALYVVESKNDIERIKEEAKHALSLTSTVGISAALSDQFTKASDVKILMSWIIASIFFLAVAFGISIWIIGGWGIVDSGDWSQLIGRLVIIAISISAATFCAKQYVKQKNLIEDYAYKLTLAKSIIAFKDEIQKTDPKLVSDYLTSVLSEIHQDPLRVRVKPKELTINDKAIESIQKIVTTIKD